MKRGKKMSDQEVVVTRDYVKSTYLLDPVMKENLQYIALRKKREQSDMVREVFRTFITNEGLDPARSPFAI